jgi:hypothetical protein
MTRIISENVAFTFRRNVIAGELRAPVSYPHAKEWTITSSAHLDDV